MRKGLLAIGVVYGLLALAYVSWDAPKSQATRSGARQWALACPPPGIAPTCGRQDWYPLVRGD